MTRRTLLLVALSLLVVFAVVPGAFAHSGEEHIDLGAPESAEPVEEEAPAEPAPEAGIKNEDAPAGQVESEDETGAANAAGENKHEPAAAGSKDTGKKTPAGKTDKKVEKTAMAEDGHGMEKETHAAYQVISPEQSGYLIAVAFVMLLSLLFAASVIWL